MLYITDMFHRSYYKFQVLENQDISSSVRVVLTADDKKAFVLFPPPQLDRFPKTPINQLVITFSYS